MNGSADASTVSDRPSALLAIDNLTVAYRQGDTWQRAVRDVSLSLQAGESCGIVGESGSGKSTLALAIMRYLPEDGEVQGGRITFEGRDLLNLRRHAMRRIWGSKIALVPQDARSSLNPSLHLGEQVTEILRHHRGMGKREAYDDVLELFERVRLGDPERVAQSYPHQLSGGMLQRVLIAMALSTRPSLLLLDEPTSSLDVTTQAAILDLVRELVQGRGRTAVLYITHDLGVVGQICDRVAVMYAGELIEDAPTGDIYRQPLHPYTHGLLDCVPRLGKTKYEVDLRPIQGQIPSLSDLPEGCIFQPRCPLAIDICQEHPPLSNVGNSRSVRCHRWEGIRAGDLDAQQPSPTLERQLHRHGGDAVTLEIEDVKVTYHDRPSLTELLRRQDSAQVKAVDGVSLRVQRSRTLGLVGESGSGKTTLARAILGLAPRTGGQMRFMEADLPSGLQGRGKDTLCCLQIVFQDPTETLNPYLTVGETLRRPLLRLRGTSDTETEHAIAEMLEAVHLSPEYAKRLPGQLSGGEKQRVAIARAFAPNPSVLVADEPVSSLDVSVQASILNLLNELQGEHDVSILFISHDLAVVGYLADDIAVVYLGELMEVSSTQQIFDPPYHPYTEALLSSVPLIDLEAGQREVRLEGEVPSPANKPTGCPFHTRCHRFLGEVCAHERPPWRGEAGSKRYFCHIPWEDLVASQARVLAPDAEEYDSGGV